VEEQITRGIRFGRKRYRAGGFFAYFQAYTTTYAPPEALRERYEVIRRFPEVVGLAVGTRPDCVDEAVLDLLASYAGDYEVWVEYGLQSASDATLERIRRGHSVEAFLQALTRTASRPILICVHVILGLPGEGHEEMMETARLLAGLPIHGVKIHHCHVIRGTPLAEDYLQGRYAPLEYSRYLACACDFLENLPWPITIQRLVGEASPELLLAPDWGQDKARVLRDIQTEMERRGSYQGKHAPRHPPKSPLP
jgi:radical SAM protein (TIGR01212 family)